VFCEYKWTIHLPEIRVRVVFSDDSGRGSTREEPFTVVTAAMFNMDAEWDSFVTDFHQAAVEATGSGDVEAKGARLLSDALDGKQNAAQWLAAILTLPQRHNIPIFYGAIHRLAFEKLCKEYMEGLRGSLRNPVGLASGQDMAFADCLKRVETYAQTFVPREQVLWIADNGGNETTGKKFELKWSQFMEIFTALAGQIEEVHKNTGKPHNEIAKEDWASLHVRRSGFLPHAMASRVIDPVYFGDSKESCAIQLADVCCAVITGRLLDRSGIEPYYTILRSQIVNDGTPPLFTTARPWFG
jgi:Protein of unknown function (DUF3800)